MQKTILIIPCYNEAQRLLTEAFMQAAVDDPALAFLFVDDGSTDSTRSALVQLCARRPKQMAVLVLKHNVGKAEAVRQGSLAAFERAPAIIGYFDADLATPLSEIAPMRALFDESVVEMVLGSRVGLLGREIQRSARRHYLGRVFGTAASLVLGVPVYDTQCGAKLFRNTERTRDIFSQPFSVDWTFDVEILARLFGSDLGKSVGCAAGLAVEYPLRRWRDMAGSKLGFAASLRAATDLWVVWVRYRHDALRALPRAGRLRQPGRPAVAPAASIALGP
jgi:dolichyl-phosphate beta-glucosyltransferase